MKAVVIPSILITFCLLKTTAYPQGKSTKEITIAWIIDQAKKNRSFDYCNYRGNLNHCKAAWENEKVLPPVAECWLDIDVEELNVMFYSLERDWTCQLDSKTKTNDATYFYFLNVDKLEISFSLKDVDEVRAAKDSNNIPEIVFITKGLVKYRFYKSKTKYKRLMNRYDKQMAWIRMKRIEFKDKTVSGNIYKFKIYDPETRDRMIGAFNRLIDIAKE